MSLVGAGMLAVFRVANLTGRLCGGGRLGCMRWWYLLGIPDKETLVLFVCANEWHAARVNCQAAAFEDPVLSRFWLYIMLVCIRCE